MAPRKTAAAAQPDLLTVEAVSSGTIKTGDKITEAGKPDRVVGAVVTGKAARTRRDLSTEVKQPPAQVVPANILAVIARAAADPHVNADKMRQLLDMQKEVVAEEARLAFTAAYRALQKELPVINADRKIEIKEKDQRGQRTGPTQQSTPYATFQAIMRVVKPLLDKHGFSLSFATEPSEDNTRLVIVGYLDHDKGHQRTSRFPLPAEVSGSKNNVQGWGSTQSYGKRYVTIALLNIVSYATGDRDLDGHSPNDVIEGESESIQTISENEVFDLNRAIMECGVPFATFCKTWKIQKLEQLPVADLAEALKRCAEYKARAAEARK